MLRYRCSLLFFVTEFVKENGHHIPFLQIIRFHHSKSERKKGNVLETKKWEKERTSSHEDINVYSPYLSTPFDKVSTEFPLYRKGSEKQNSKCHVAQIPL